MNGTSLCTGRSFGGNPEGKVGWPKTGTGSGDGIERFRARALFTRFRRLVGNFVSGQAWTRSTYPSDLAARLNVKRKHLGPHPEDRKIIIVGMTFLPGRTWQRQIHFFFMAG
jgi:hypothetical protein